MSKEKIFRITTSNQGDASSLHVVHSEDEMDKVSGINIYFNEDEKDEAEDFLKKLQEFINVNYNNKHPERKIEFKYKVFWHNVIIE